MSALPDLVRRAVIVDVLPATGERTQSMTQEQRGAVSLVAGPPIYDSFDAMLQATSTPDVKIKLFYERDFARIASRFGLPRAS